MERATGSEIIARVLSRSLVIIGVSIVLVPAAHSFGILISVKVLAKASLAMISTIIMEKEKGIRNLVMGSLIILNPPIFRTFRQLILTWVYLHLMIFQI